MCRRAKDRSGSQRCGDPRALRIENLECRQLLAAHPLYFQPATEFAAGDSPNAVAVGDFNHDGWLDLATANELSNNVTILLGNGDGTFLCRRLLPPARGHAVMAADLNGDGVSI